MHTKKRHRIHAYHTIYMMKGMNHVMRGINYIQNEKHRRVLMGESAGYKTQNKYI